MLATRIRPQSGFLPVVRIASLVKRQGPVWKALLFTLAGLFMIGVLITLPACGGTTGGTGSTGSTGSTSAPAPTATLSTENIPAQQVVASPTPEPAATLRPESAPATSGPELGIGSTGESSGMKVTVNGVTRSSESPFGSLEPGNEYLIVDVTVDNTANAEKSLIGLGPSIEDSAGNKYNFTMEAIGFPSPFLGEISPNNNKVRGTVPFQVPVGAKGLAFVCHPSAGGVPGKVLRFNLDKTSSGAGAPTEGGTTAPATNLRIGSTGETNGLRVTLNSVNHEPIEAGFLPTGTEYVRVGLTIENITDQPKQVFGAHFFVKDDASWQYATDWQKSREGVVGTGLVQLASHQKSEGDLYFPVRVGSKGLVLVYDPGSSVFARNKALRFDLEATTTAETGAAQSTASSQTPGTSTSAIKELAIGGTGEFECYCFSKDLDKHTPLKVTVNGVKHASTGLKPPESGNEYVIVDLTLDNVGSETIDPYAFFTVVGVEDSTGPDHRAGILSGISSGATTNWATTLPPNQKARGQVAFQMPANAKGLVFYVKPHMFSEAAVLRFKLDR